MPCSERLLDSLGLLRDRNAQLITKIRFLYSLSLHSQNHKTRSRYSTPALLLLPFPVYGRMILLARLGRIITRHQDVPFAVSQCLFGQIQQRELICSDDFTLNYIPDGLAEQLHDAEVLDPVNFVTTLEGVISDPACRISCKLYRPGTVAET
ncbi:hypothetical protein BV898_19227 [Hypsibius exemplaris]|uniref:Uncharacterized protein n=1 Tax=Hypsibius exemplaris TaxID=2072580 RepID=A0A9X6NLA3_HYPEX|nr:hypothetical protein BV898_19227 [Hypsibius exemplaris]